MKQLDMFELVIETESKGRITAQRLTSIENRVLDILKQRDISTLEIMQTYGLSDVHVRKVINNIRNKKSSNVIVGNVSDLTFDNKRNLNGYSVKRDNNLGFLRLKSSIETHLRNNPFDLEKVYVLVNEMKSKIENERLAQGQQEIKFTKNMRGEVNYYK